MSAMEIDRSLLARWALPDPRDGESKEDRGRVLIVGGSREIPGAALLAALASLRSGAGKLHVATADDAAPGLALAMPEARVSGLVATPRGEIGGLREDVLRAARHADAVLVGPGMLASDTVRRVAGTLAAVARHSVLDAGALGSEPGRATVVTPHHGEMASLLGCSKDDVGRDAQRIAIRYARERDVVTVLKAATTYIASPSGEVFVHRGGTIGLGTSGSGDVLAGTIAGLIAQGAALDQAAVWGVALHGAAGTALTKRLGLVGFLAREIADEIPRVRAALAP